jgi:glutamate N-acetyltransferase / amino-acid N-acetyltransferase
MNTMKIITGGVCAAQGFTANGVHCGIRRNRSKRDLSLIVSSAPCTGAGVYTRNKVKGAPILVTRDHLGRGVPQAVIVNSGKANTCNADGVEVAERMTRLAAEALHLAPESVLVASTGVIGVPLDTAPIEKGLPELVQGLERSEEASVRAAEGIMTTDTVRKEAAVEFEAGGKTCRIGAIGKGSGMIHPDLATMLVFITTDCAISSEMLRKALSHDVQKTFNMTSVDGDTSTNDMVLLLANGLAGNARITAEGADFDAFMKALNTITVAICRSIAGDGEGATKLLECRVTGAKTEEAARIAAKSVITSSLVKAAMFGADANWGRVLCAIGYSGADVDVNKVELSFASKAGKILVCRSGAGVPFSEEEAKKILLEKEIDILIDLHDGEGSATAWGCDLTYDYVKINGDYRS